ncbi:MAG: hypothetical protein ACK5UI_05485 [Bacteroidota bacterium]
MNISLKQFITPCFIFVILLTACNSKRYAYRITQPVNQQQKVSIHQLHQTQIKLPAVHSLPNNVVTEAKEMIMPKKFHPMVSVDDTLIKKYKFDKQETPRNGTRNEINSESENNKDFIEEAQLKRYGTLGFIYGLASIVLTPILLFPIFFSVPGLIYSIKGLKAKRNGLAVAGLTMSILVLSILLYLIIMISISIN